MSRDTFPTVPAPTHHFRPGLDFADNGTCHTQLTLASLDKSPGTFRCDLPWADPAHANTPAYLSGMDVTPHSFHSVGPDYDDCSYCNMGQFAVIHKGVIIDAWNIARGKARDAMRIEYSTRHHELTHNGYRRLQLYVNVNTGTAASFLNADAVKEVGPSVLAASSDREWVEVKRFLVCPECNASAAIDAMARMISHLRTGHRYKPSQLDQYRTTPRVREYDAEEHTLLHKITDTPPSAPVETIERAIAELKKSVEDGIASILQAVESGEVCTHPNGHGPNGCAGCGSAAPTPQDDADKVTSPKWQSIIDAAADWNPGRSASPEDEFVTQAQDPYAPMRQELTTWWVELAAQEADKVVPKAVEYGATDLIDIGHDLARTAGRDVTDEEASEMGVYFYLRGKLARWTDALIRGDRPSDDTLHDLGVYVRMAQRIREVGSWPGVEMPGHPDH